MAIDNIHNEEKNDEMMELILRSLRGEISSFEQSLLLEWCAESPEHKAQYDQVTKIWNSSRKIESDFEPNVDQAWQKVLNQIDPKIIQLNPTVEEDLSELILIKRNPFTVWKIAAAVSVLLGLGFAMQYFTKSQVEYVTFRTGNVPEDLDLPDSSKIWVNKNSRIVYAKDFADGTRTVTLDGEAFFDIKKSKTAPFTVIAHRSLTKVMGTSFRIHSFTKDDFDEIDVVTGKVMFGQKDDTVKNRCFLLPGDYAKLNNEHQLTATKISDLNSLAWKTGTLAFDHATLGQVWVSLEKFYSVSIETAETDLLEQKFTGTFENTPLDDVLKVIAVTFSLEYKKEENNIIFSKKK
ncbi:MAG: DUF4974 domain-containing protein [Cytophagales bacterium]|nr:DUF4974 domain-containing protein [Cytophagales bacterium]